MVHDKTHSTEWPGAFGGVTVLVVGDVMLDRYWRGTASRLSPEGPVPVVLLNEITDIPGGAANVAANAAALGARVILAGVVGKDAAGKCLADSCAGIGADTVLLVELDGRMTTSKTRVQALNHQIVRIDDEDALPLDRAEGEQFVAAVRPTAEAADVIVFSDYASEPTIRLIATARR